MFDFNKSNPVDIDLSANAFGFSSNRLGRVYSIITERSSANLDELPIGTIKFAFLDEDSFTGEFTSQHTAYPLNTSILELPLVNEVVLIHSGPKESRKKRNDSIYKTYYSKVVSAWGAVNHNALPDPDLSTEEFSLGNKLPELPNINNLALNSGDLLLDSRFGSSLRFSGYIGANNKYTDEDNNGKPFTILSNGRAGDHKDLTYDKIKLVNESINTDDSSIYLTSDHQIPLKEPSGKELPSSKVGKHTLASSYRGAQIILNSNRLFFNAKQDDIVFTANESITGIAQNINLDGKDYVSIEGEKIYLGKEPKNALNTAGAESLPDPVILGDRLEVFLDDLLTELANLANSLRNNAVVGLVNVPLTAAGATLTQGIIELKKQITPLKNNGTSRLKSTKVFVGEGKDFKKDRSI